MTALDAHRIQPFYAGLLARPAALTVGMAMEGDTVVVDARNRRRAICAVNEWLSRAASRADPQPKLNASPTHWPRSRRESGGRADARR